MADTASDTSQTAGIIPRATEEIFGFIENAVSERKKFLVRASYLQIYNEVISDLLKPERTNLHIREDKRRGVFVEGLSEWVVRTPKEVYGLMQRGAMTRATASTKMNEISSRSHAVFIIISEQLEYIDDDTGAQEPGADGESGYKGQAFKVGKLNLVDLAGSERVRLTGATGRRLEESKKINQSLSALGNVIAALTDAKARQHIPYRDSKLTRILEDSLGGNCKTTMMAMISPALEAMPESLSTLKFANRAKNIKNQARVNEDLDQRGLLRKYEQEIRKLRSELDNKSKEIVDKRKVLQLEELRRRAEADKVAALSALEEKSLQFMREKQEKRLLERRLHSMSSQLLIGGGDKTVEAGAGMEVRAKEHDRLQREYSKKLEDLENERKKLEDDKSQVDRYKHLLIKQRDIMIALTSRLTERDDTIMRLQEELDAYDTRQMELEDEMDKKTSALISLQRLAMEQAGNQPELRAKVMTALSQGDYGQDSPDNNDNNIFSAADVRASGSGALNGLRAAAPAAGGGGKGREQIPAHMQQVIYEILQEEMDERIDEIRRQHQVQGGGEAARELADLKERYAVLEKHCKALEARDGDGAGAGKGGSSEEVAVLRSQLDTMHGKHVDFKQEVTVRISQKNKTIKDLEEKLAKLAVADKASTTAHAAEETPSHVQARLTEEERGRATAEKKLDTLRKVAPLSRSRAPSALAFGLLRPSRWFCLAARDLLQEGPVAWCGACAAASLWCLAPLFCRMSAVPVAHTQLMYCRPARSTSRTHKRLRRCRRLRNRRKRSVESRVERQASP